jgi:hypothetical protein
MKYHLPDRPEQPVTPDDAEHEARLIARGWVAIPEPPPADPEPPPHYHDDTESIDLDVSTEAQGRFTSLVTLVQLGTGLGVVTGETIQEIRDVHGDPHLLPVARLLPLMLRYGSHCAALFALSR